MTNNRHTNRIYTDLSTKVIGCAIEVHRNLGPGLLEATYQQCLAHEFRLNDIVFQMEHPLPIDYKGVRLDCGYRLDFLIDSTIILELKSVNQLKPIDEAQLLTYLKLSGVKQGYLLNFNVIRLMDGLRSLVV
jgi:GxxExxY protein